MAELWSLRGLSWREWIRRTSTVYVKRAPFGDACRVFARDAKRDLSASIQPNETGFRGQDLVNRCDAACGVRDMSLRESPREPEN